jgi:hypothetical protein
VPLHREEMQRVLFSVRDGTAGMAMRVSEDESGGDRERRFAVPLGILDLTPSKTDGTSVKEEHDDPEPHSDTVRCLAPSARDANVWLLIL